MPKIDPDKEKRRLASLYAAMSDRELQKLSGNRDIDRWGLRGAASRDEKSESGLGGKRDAAALQMVTSKPPEDLGNRPVVLRRYRDMPEAFVAKSVREDAGCVLQDDNVLRMDWFWSNALRGIKLLVRQKDAEESVHLLSAAPGESGKTTIFQTTSNSV